MDTMSAFAMGEASRDNPPKVFDWDKAAQLIRERNPKEASAGLAEDWGCTGGDIYRDGAPVPQGQTYTYLTSTWAAPVLQMDGEAVECWMFKKDSPGWDSGTYWPESALAILNAKGASR